VLTLPAEAACLHLGLGLACFKYRSTDQHTRDPHVSLALLLGILLDIMAALQLTFATLPPK